MDPNVKVEILAPNSASYKDLNNYSIMLKVTYGKTSFLLTGDAERESEKEMLAKGYNLKADVLKVGHHGSNSSTSATFLKAVAPQYAVICVGKGMITVIPNQTGDFKPVGAGWSEGFPDRSKWYGYCGK